MPLTLDTLIEDPVVLGYPKGWGAGSIREKDWFYLKQTILDLNVNSLVEIGVGLSTLLMSQLVPNYVGYDTLQRHLDWMKGQVPDHVELRLWDGKSPLSLHKKFDMGFIDGPNTANGGWGRKNSFKVLVHHVNILAMHDTGYAWDREWRFDLDSEGCYIPHIPGGGLSIWKLKEMGSRGMGLRNV